jgi:uridine phosphorylase
MKNLRVKKNEVPDKLIIEGRIRSERGMAGRADRLRKVKPGWEPGIITGEYGDRKVAFAMCVGGPVASQISHLYCKLGVKKIIHIGTGGGLQKNIALGDIIVSKRVLSLDGCAKLYKQKSRLVGFDKGLVSAVTAQLKQRNLRHHVGRTVTYYDILLEEMKDLRALCRAGYLGVEMEAASVASVANYFGVPAVSLFYASDNSMTGKTIFHSKTPKELEATKAASDAIFEIALSV